MHPACVGNVQARFIRGTLASTMPDQPNLLILMADQLTPRVLKAYGGQVARTPNMDVLAKEGVVFDSFYCNSPLCAPSRFSFMAGQLPSQIGAYDNAAEFPAQVPTFAHYLRAAGYQTALSGRCISAVRISCTDSKSG